MAKIEVTTTLAEEDRKLLKDTAALVTKALAALAGGKPAKPTKTAPKDEAADEDFDDMGDDAADDEAADDEAGDDEAGDDEAGDDEAGDDADEVTVDMVGEALKAYATAKGPGGEGSKALAVKLLKAKGGTDKLSALKKDKFQAVIDAAKAATAKLKKKPAK
jgi:hypothetical protein